MKSHNNAIRYDSFYYMLLEFCKRLYVKRNCTTFTMLPEGWLSKDPAGIAGGMNLYQYCNSNPTPYVDAMVWNPNVNPMHPANLLPRVPEIYPAEVFPPLILSTPATERVRPLIIPGSSINDAELEDIILDVFPVALPGLDALIEIFPAVERYFFQNVVCTKGKSDSETEEFFSH